MNKGPNLPVVLAVFWAKPTEDGNARYVVDFGSDLEPGHLDALNRLIRQHGAFKSAESGPLSNQATVILNNKDTGYSRLDWLKQQLNPQAVGTVIVDLYPEVNPAVARLTALGVFRFCDDDLPLIRYLPGVESATLSSGVVTATFYEDWAEENGREALLIGFVQQQEFAATTVVKPGTPPGAA